MSIQRQNLRNLFVLLAIIVMHGLVIAAFLLKDHHTPNLEKIEMLQAELLPPPPKVTKEQPVPKEKPKPPEKPVPTPKILSIAPEKAKPTSTPSPEPIKEQPQKKAAIEPVAEATTSTQEAKTAAPVSKSSQAPATSDLGVEGGSVKLNQLKMVYKPDTNVFYPRISKDIGEQGTVGVILFIDETGSVSKTQIVNSSGFKRLDKAAEELCIRIRFLPYLVDGQPTKVSAGITIKFEMNR